MLIDLRSILDRPGARLSFRTELDFSDFMFGAQKPVTEPVYASGEIFNKAGVTFLLADVKTDLHCVCDLCASDFVRDCHSRIEVLLCENPEEDDTESYPIENDSVDVDEIITSAFVLDMDSRFLCRPDCRGICAQCGADLNDGPCGCAEETDSRWAALKDLF